MLVKPTLVLKVCLMKKKTNSKSIKVSTKVVLHWFLTNAWILIQLSPTFARHDLTIYANVRAHLHACLQMRGRKKCKKKSRANLKSTSRHIFEKVLICIDRGIFSTDINQMNTFENFIFGKRCSFLLASWAVPIL